MKKLITLIFAVTVLCTTSFAKNFFTSRIFEVKFGADLGLSNNLLSCKDIMKKNLVIDLRKMADECPKSGFDIRGNFDPSLEVNLNIFGLNLGLATGIESYEKFVIGKDLFNFLGYGNSVGQKIDINFNNTTDIFYYTQATVGFNIGKLKIKAQPALFVPVLSIHDSGASFTVLNDSDGNLKVGMNMNMDVYSTVPLKSVDGDIEFESTSNILAGSYGFDLGGSVGFPITDSFLVEGVCRIPVIPGHLRNKATVHGGFVYDMTLTDFENSNNDSKETTVTNESAYYTLNRPLKVGVYASKDLLGTLLNARAGGGLGIQRPFCIGVYCYPEYYAGITLNLINIFKVGLSTEYTNQMFKHQIGTSVNVRLIQLDFGISSQSSSFKKSFEVSGVGAYAYVTIGF